VIVFAKVFQEITPHPLVGIILATSIFVACGPDEETTNGTQGSRDPKVEVVDVEKHAFETKRAWQGTLEPLRVYEIVAPENGRVSEFRLDVGDLVSAGDVVVKMRFPYADARRGHLAERVGQLEVEKERLKRLAASRATSDAEVAAARIDLLQAMAELRGIEALLAEGIIRAPADGWILETAVVAGSSVVEETVLARLADASSMGIRIQVPNTEIRYFDDVGMLTATTSGGGRHPITRTMRHGTQGSNTTGVELWLDVRNPEFVGAATIGYKSANDVLAVPWSSVATDDNMAWVGLLDDENRVERRTVTLGATSGTMVEVLDGLDDGDTVLLYQPRSHGEGARVDPVPRNKSSETD